MTIVFVLKVMVVLSTLLYSGLILFQSIMILVREAPLSPVDSPAPISIIIPFRNEQIHIADIITDLNQMNSRNFEVLFVNDHSDDNTKFIIEEQAKFDFQVINSSQTGKKQAIIEGVKNSKYSILASLDADVRIDDNWLSQVQRYFSTTKENSFLIMPVINQNEQGFWGHFESLDVLALTGTTISWAIVKHPILCNGANMAYRKSVFNEFRLHPSDERLVSGDDVFFMHQVKAKSKTGIGILHNSKVIARTNTFNNAKNLMNQRVRWASKSLAYNDKDIKMVGWIVLLNYVLIIGLAISSVVFPSLVNLFLIVFISKVFIDFLFLVLLAIKFNKVKSLIYYPLSALVQIVFVPLIFFKSQFGYFMWRGRQYKE